MNKSANWIAYSIELKQREKSWDTYFINMAMHVATKSKDRSTVVGAIIVGPDHEIRSTGYNGFPRGVDDDIDSRHERPEKYSWTEHAERNAIYNAARVGIATKGCTMYINWEPSPCDDCSRAIVQSGITTVIGPDHPFPGKGDWTSKMNIGTKILTEGRVVIRQIKLFDAVPDGTKE